MYGPEALWTAAHHRIPMLVLMHNNRAYHQEIMQLQHMAGLHNRGFEQCGIGTTITDPNIDYAKLASSMGVESYGPVDESGRPRSGHQARHRSREARQPVSDRRRDPRTMRMKNLLILAALLAAPRLLRKRPTPATRTTGRKYSSA